MDPAPAPSRSPHRRREALRRWAGTTAAALLALGPLDAAGQAAEDAPFRLAGRVLDGATDAPIAGALVAIEDMGIATLSDGNGFFALQGVTPGRHVFVTTHESFHANREASVVGPGALLFVRLLAVSVPEIARASGHVLDLEPGMKVRVLLAEGARSLDAVLRDLRPDTLLLGYPPSVAGSVMPVPVAEIAELQVSVGRRNLIPVGASVGALLGALVVAGYNSLLASQCVLDCERGPSILAGVGVGALVGGVGLSFIRAERWVEIPLGR